MKNILLKIENKWNVACDKAYHRINDWMWSRKESKFDKFVLDKMNPEWVLYEKEYHDKVFDETIKEDLENPDRFIPQYDENLNRIWSKN